MRRPIPKIVGKLRYLCRSHPDRKLELVTAANRLLLSVNSLNTPPALWPYSPYYRQAAALIYRVTGEHWRGE